MHWLLAWAAPHDIRPIATSSKINDSCFIHQHFHGSFLRGYHQMKWSSNLAEKDICPLAATLKQINSPVQ